MGKPTYFFVNFVADAIDQHRHMQIEVDLTRRRDLGTFVVGGRLGIDDVLDQVVGHAPAVVGVRFTDVDDVEPHLILVRGVEFIKAHGLIAEGRSREGTEDQTDGTAAKIG